MTDPLGTVSFVRAFRALALLLLVAPWSLLGADPVSADVPGFDPRLGGRIRARLSKAGIRSGRYSVAVLERGTGRMLCFDGQATSLIPASVAKVLTAASALDHLGPGHRLVTRVTTTGKVVGGRLDADLVVHGGADPTLTMDDLQALARKVRDAGVARVTGDLRLDDGALDREFTYAGWLEDDLRHVYGAGVGGLSIGEGTLLLKATGTRAGAKATLTFPWTSGPWPVVNNVKTAAGGKAAIGGAFASGKLKAGGKVPAGKGTQIRVPVPDPVLFFGTAFSRALRDAGVVVDGRIGPAAARHADGTELARIEHDLAGALRDMNVSSRNVHASTLFKLAGARVGGVGTWGTGEQAVTRMAEGRGIAAGGTKIVDGSGLSPTNRVTAGLLVQVLHAFDEDPLRGPMLFDSLPTSGVDGTLRRRLGSLKGRVHAKTGTLNDHRVRSLAGYIDGKGDRPGSVFAIVLNGRGSNHAVIDDIVREIARR